MTKLFKEHILFAKIIFIFFVISFSSQLHSQQLPPINNFTTKNYNAESQNWSISQSRDGNIYVANNLGLLEFNGAKWKLYDTPNSTIMRSVKSIENRVFTGFYMDFGFWTRNDFGNLEFTSLVKKHNISVLEDEQFWNILHYDDWILFQSLQRIYFYNLNTNEFKIISSGVKITKMFSVQNTIYFQKLGKGLYKLDNGKSKLVSDDNLFKNNDIINIHQKDNNLLILTNNEGFIILDKQQITYWKEANKSLKNKSIYNSIKLKNGSFAVGTISDGIIIISENGKQLFKMSQENGLNNNTVLALYEDTKGAVWLGLDNGISSFDINSQIKVFKEKKGRIGSVYATTIFHDHIYLGSNQGLFVKKYKSKERFELIEGTQGQVWSLNKIDDKLFCGHDTGTIIIDQKKIINKISIQGTWNVKLLKPNIILQGNYNGLYILEKKSNKWRLKNKIEGFNISSRSFETINSNQIFVNHEYKGIFKLKINDSFDKVIAIEKDSILGKGLHSNLIKYNDNIYYASKRGVFKFSNSKNTYFKDSILSSIFTKENYTTGKLIIDNDVLWGFSKKDITYIKPNIIDQKLTLKKIPISQEYRKSVSGYENLYVNENELIIGGNNGYVLLKVNLKKSRIASYGVHINSIKKNLLDENKENVLLNRNGVFTEKENNIEFNYNVPFLEQNAIVEYQYKLEGYLNSWSSWSAKSNMAFENLPQGRDYIFYVKAKVGNAQTTNIASYKFRIDNLWYLRKWVIVLYVAFGLLFLFVLDRAYKKYYRTQRKRLLEKQEKDFKLITLAKEKELIQSRNDQLNIDVQSKSRELATSTMSIIKKNELLGMIKNELKVGGENGVKSVVKIIDKNLNNTDDWQVFKEAFNNADKDFIKKLKEIHTSLTPNDLRLCAYLRLNLSSKEIAPLLNISPRSVEVKRYRLRKKMNLEHNDSLTDYILNI